MVPPLERLERREEPEAQGGEFVEADDCKAYEANKPDEGACLGRKCNVRRISTMAKSSCISGKCSLLSKGLRGGKSRRLRVESLSRRMLQVKTQKTHCKYASKKESKDVACDIRLQDGENMVESGEFAETQVQRPPDQHSS
ncbi:MAG: hypothetical protein CL920_28100 [Deltaproteobacteria bacterium]|nr:hypothetical protein [Deltaproteobacteria bacterium]